MSATPEMTGIPSDVLLMAKMEDMKVIISDLKSPLETSFKTTLAIKIDSREVGGYVYSHSKQYVDRKNSTF